MTDQVDLYKKIAGEKAVEYIEDGMVLGLGSGSTVYWTLKKLGGLIEQGLNIKGIPSSLRTEGWAKYFNVPLTDFSDVQVLDLAIDGADEIDPNFNLTKGGGGSLVREKMVNFHAKKVIIIADQSKMVDELGKFPLPVEVLQFGWQVTAQKIADLGAKPVLRERDGCFFVSNNDNYILDCEFNSIPDPEKLHHSLKQLLGVVETGLFVNMTDMVILAGAKGVKVINKTNQI
ncbi:ribose-5-phosphate isomerase RpiA [Paenisporosarcina antarctica]|uniref:Ribose-5-phosphate isomerase A n=1 Tax=Paenisporosarcina antarctica TaxID=417367 RepID=A0A4V1ANE4_9BACL|nr:ribose-5-phosphate isomerase RpiA [Paenisporosarcina antarctica]QBP42485.1 ribose-5-phosphate isomerase RpiA [Paenisporosarcina antarctica]